MYLPQKRFKALLRQIYILCKAFEKSLCTLKIRFVLRNKYRQPSHILSQHLFREENSVMIIFTILLAALTKLIAPVLGLSTPQNFPPALSAEEERRQFRLMRTQNPTEAENARQTLILHNLRLVAHIVRKYYSASKNQEDLVSIGTIGLVKAVDTFNIENGARFATYAAKCIQNAILS